MTCPKCEGTGWFGTEHETCEDCGGTGVVDQFDPAPAAGLPEGG